MDLSSLLPPPPPSLSLEREGKLVTMLTKLEVNVQAEN